MTRNDITGELNVIDKQKVDPTIKEILEHAKVYHQAYDTYKHLIYDKCQIPLMPNDLERKFNLEKGGLLNSLLEAYHLYRVEQDENI